MLGDRPLSPAMQRDKEGASLQERDSWVLDARYASLVSRLDTTKDAISIDKPKFRDGIFTRLANIFDER